MSMMDKVKKNSKIKEAIELSDSKLYSDKDSVATSIPMLNVALGGNIEGGLTGGVTVFAGPSKHFKSLLALILAAAYMKKHKDSVMIFYDSEFGMPEAYFTSLNIDRSRVLHVPIKDIEELKFDLISQLNNLTRGDKVVVVIDSIGNVASKKELEDAINEKSVADMSRAKAIKSLFRMTTPYLTIKDIPLIAINHTYSEQGLYPRQIVSGGCVIAGTKIILADGSSTKNIEEILPGDIVMTKMGPREVTYTWNPDTLIDGNPECYEIEFDDGYKVICSSAHKFLVDGEWVEANALIPGIDVEII